MQAARRSLSRISVAFAFAAAIGHAFRFPGQGPGNCSVAGTLDEIDVSVRVGIELVAVVVQRGSHASKHAVIARTNACVPRSDTPPHPLRPPPAKIGQSWPDTDGAVSPPFRRHPLVGQSWPSSATLGQPTEYTTEYRYSWGPPAPRPAEKSRSTTPLLCCGGAKARGGGRACGSLRPVGPPEASGPQSYLG